MVKTLICALAFFLSACGPYRVEKNASPMVETEKITALDLVLKNLNVVKHESTALQDGRLKVQVSMENERNKDIWADIQIVFRDDKGTEIERTSWEAKQFHRRSVSMYERVSLSSMAKDYRVIIRKVK